MSSAQHTMLRCERAANWDCESRGQLGRRCWYEMRLRLLHSSQRSQRSHNISQERECKQCQRCLPLFVSRESEQKKKPTEKSRSVRFDFPTDSPARGCMPWPVRKSNANTHRISPGDHQRHKGIWRSLPAHAPEPACNGKHSSQVPLDWA